MKNNSQKGFIMPIILGIIALLVIGSGVYIYQNKKANTPAVMNSEAQKVNIQTSTVNTQIDTSGWQTYKNNKYGFEFQYPGNSGEFIRYSEGGEEYWQSSDKKFFVQVKPLPDNFKFVEQKENVGEYIDCKTSSGLQYCIKGFGDESYRSDQVEIYNFDKKTSILITNQVENETDVYLLEKIIPTFKFTK